MKIRLSQVLVEEQRTPRSGFDWRTVLRYADAIRAGAVFPPVLVGKCARRKGSFVLIDGFHRVRAATVAGKKDVEADITSLPEREWFAAAVEANMAHGITLSPYDIARSVLRLRKLKYSDKVIAKIVAMPVGTMQRIVANKIARINGEVVPLKRTIAHLSKSEGGVRQLEEIDNMGGIMQEQRQMSGAAQSGLVAQLILLIQMGVLATDDAELVRSLVRLRDALDAILAEVAVKCYGPVPEK